MPTPYKPHPSAPPPLLTVFLRFLCTYWRLHGEFPDTERVAEKFRCPRHEVAMDMLPLVQRGFVQKAHRNRWHLTDKGIALFGAMGPGAGLGPGTPSGT